MKYEFIKQSTRHNTKIIKNQIKTIQRKTMKKLATLTITIIIVSLFTGCPVTVPNKPNKKVVKTIVNNFTTEFRKDELRYECYVRGYEYNEETLLANVERDKLSKPRGGRTDTEEEKTAVCRKDTVDKSKYATDAKRIRDNVVSRFIRVIDSNYEQFINDLQNHRSTTNFLGDVTELGLGTAVGVTNGERVLQILGVALTAFRGGRKSVDQNFYERQSTPILITKMDTSRDRIMSAILIKRERFGVDKYSLEDALGDVIKYFWAGTLTRAFVELSKDSSIQAKEAEKELSIIEGIPINLIPSIQRQQFSNDIFAQRESLEKQFLAAEKLLSGTDKEVAIQKITAKYEMIWTDIEATDEFKAIVTELKSVSVFSTTISKINNAANPPTKAELLSLFAKFSKRIADEDDKATNTKLQETYLTILKKVNQ